MPDSPRSPSSFNSTIALPTVAVRFDEPPSFVKTYRPTDRNVPRSLAIRFEAAEPFLVLSGRPTTFFEDAEPGEPLIGRFPVPAVPGAPDTVEIVSISNGLGRSVEIPITIRRPPQ